jgi:hypothetical protein
MFRNNCNRIVCIEQVYQFLSEERLTKHFGFSILRHPLRRRNVPTTHRINPDHLRLVLQVTAHSPTAQCRWAAMTATVASPACADRARGHDWRLTLNPMCTPLMRGRMQSVVERTRLHHGLPEVRRTWGTGLRAMLAETQSGMLPRATRTGAAQ